MVWNKEKPSDQERIHDIGSVIRPNWKAIEQASDSDTDAQKLKLWAVNLVDRSQPVVTGPASPSKIGDNAAANNAEAGQVYCHNDGTFNELFFIGYDVTANEIQLTKDNRIGTSAQGVNASNLMFDSTTPVMTYGINQMISATGTFSSLGVLVQGVNMGKNAAPHPDTGEYRVDVLADVLLNVNYKIIATVLAASGATLRNIHVLSKPAPVPGTKTAIRLKIRGSSASHNQQFDIIIVGGR